MLKSSADLPPPPLFTFPIVSIDALIDAGTSDDPPENRIAPTMPANPPKGLTAILRDIVTEIRAAFTEAKVRDVLPSAEDGCGSGPREREEEVNAALRKRLATPFTQIETPELKDAPRLLKIDTRESPGNKIARRLNLLPSAIVTRSFFPEKPVTIVLEFDDGFVTPKPGMRRAVEMEVEQPEGDMESMGQWKAAGRTWSHEKGVGGVKPGDKPRGMLEADAHGRLTFTVGDRVWFWTAGSEEPGDGDCGKSRDIGEEIRVAFRETGMRTVQAKGQTGCGTGREVKQ